MGKVENEIRRLIAVLEQDLKAHPELGTVAERLVTYFPARLHESVLAYLAEHTD